MPGATSYLLESSHWQPPTPLCSKHMQASKYKLSSMVGCAHEHERKKWHEEAAHFKIERDRFREELARTRHGKFVLQDKLDTAICTLFNLGYCNGGTQGRHIIGGNSESASNRKAQTSTRKKQDAPTPQGRYRFVLLCHAHSYPQIIQKI